MKFEVKTSQWDWNKKAKSDGFCPHEELAVNESAICFPFTVAIRLSDRFLPGDHLCSTVHLINIMLSEMYKHYPAWALKHGLGCMLVLFSSLPPLNTQLKVHLEKWEQWPFFRMFYSRNKDLSQRMKKWNFSGLYLLCGVQSKVIDAFFWVTLLSGAKADTQLWCLYVLISYASKQTNKQKLRTNYSKESKYHLECFLLCNLTTLLCSTARFLSPAWVSYSWQSGQEHNWRQVKSVQPSLCSLSDEWKHSRAELQTFLLSPFSAYSFATEPWTSPGILVWMVQHKHNAERQIQKQKPENRLLVPFIIRVGTQSYSKLWIETAGRTEYSVLISL